MGPIMENVKLLSYKIPFLITQVAILSIALHFPNTSALVISTTASISNEHSDNVLLSDTNQQSDLITTTSISLNVEENSTTLQSVINYELSHINHKKNIQNDESLIEGQAILTFSPVQDTFKWDIISSTRNLQRNRRDTDILENREKRSIISTGPTFGLNITSVDQLSLSLHKTATLFEDTDNSDNERDSADAIWTHRFSNTHRSSIGLRHSEVTFDNILLSDIQTNTFFTSYESQLSDLSTKIVAGYNESTINGNTSNAPYLESEISYSRLGHHLTVVTINQLTDSTIGLGNNSAAISSDLNTNDSNFNTPDIIERTFLSASYLSNLLCATCQTTLEFIFDKQSFENEPLDETSSNLSIGTRYQASPSTSLSINISEERIKFEQPAQRKDIIFRSSFEIFYQLTRNLSTALQLQHTENKSNLDASDYKESLLRLNLQYRIN